MNICPGNEEKHYRIFVLKLYITPWSFTVQCPCGSLAATCGNMILPTQGNYLCCGSLLAEICNIVDANTFSERLPGSDNRLDGVKMPKKKGLGHLPQNRASLYCILEVVDSHISARAANYVLPRPALNRKRQQA